MKGWGFKRRVHPRRHEARLTRRAGDPLTYGAMSSAKAASRSSSRPRRLVKASSLQCCHILFNYDIPWNPNRLDQRIGRIHRFGQRHDCLIFNFGAGNTIEGRVLQRLHEKLDEIRKALDDDSRASSWSGKCCLQRTSTACTATTTPESSEMPTSTIECSSTWTRNSSGQSARRRSQGSHRRSSRSRCSSNAVHRAQERRVVPDTITRFMRACASKRGALTEADRQT